MNGREEIFSPGFCALCRSLTFVDIHCQSSFDDGMNDGLIEVSL